MASFISDKGKVWWNSTVNNNKPETVQFTNHRIMYTSKPKTGVCKELSLS